MPNARPTFRSPRPNINKYTESQLKKMHGKVEIMNFYEVNTWEKLKALSPELQKTWLEFFVNEKGASAMLLGKWFEVDFQRFTTLARKLGVKLKGKHWTADKAEKFLQQVKSAVVEYVPLEVQEEVKEHFEMLESSFRFNGGIKSLGDLVKLLDVQYGKERVFIKLDILKTEQFEEVTNENQPENKNIELH